MGRPRKDPAARMARALDELLIKLISKGVPVLGPGGQPVLDANGQQMYVPPSAAVMEVARKRYLELRHQQPNGGHVMSDIERDLLAIRATRQGEQQALAELREAAGKAARAEDADDEEHAE